MTLRRIEAQTLRGEQPGTQSKGEIYDEAIFEADFTRRGVLALETIHVRATGPYPRQRIAT
jgi:hypothetical protein